MESLQRLVGDATLGDLGKHVLVAAFDLDNEGVTAEGIRTDRRWKPKLFHNFDGVGSDRHERVWRVGLATTAAPAFFRPFEGYIDGGVYSNNPSMCALAQVFDERYEQENKPAWNTIRLFSVGAGQNLDYVAERSPNWGVLRWGKKYVGLTMDGTVGIADYQCERFLGQARYKRLQHVFEPNGRFEIDDLKRIDELERIANDVNVAPCVAWLKEHWM